MCHILVLDDDDLAEAVRSHFEPLGARVTSVADGYDALSAIVKRRPDVVVSGPVRSRPNGEQLVRMLRSQSVRIPAILVVQGDETHPHLPPLTTVVDSAHLTETIVRMAPRACAIPGLPPGTTHDPAAEGGY